MQSVYMNGFNNIIVVTSVVTAVTVSVLLRSQISENSARVETSSTSFTKQSPKPLPVPELIGWMSFWDEVLAYDRLEEVVSRFQVFAPMLYYVDSAGALTPYTITTKEKALMLARNKNVPIMPTIGDDGDAAGLQQLLYEPVTRNQFITNLITEAQANDFVGWAFDFEVMEREDEAAYSDFVEATAAELHMAGLRLDVIVFARAAQERYSPALAHNYVRLGKVADRVILMTYGYNNELTEPGGQTPPDWLRTVITYALKTIPREKIVVGLSTHGYLWGSSDVTGLTFAEAHEIITNEELTPVLDSRSGAMTATFIKNNVTNQLFYETAETIQQKVTLIQKDFNIHTFALWRTGAEDPTVWELLQPMLALPVPSDQLNE